MEPIHACEGWFVTHLFYRVDRVRWAAADKEEREQARGAFARILDEFRRIENQQAFTYSVWGHKADLAVLLVDPELHHLNETENDLLAAFPPGTLQPVHSFTSMSEISEYMSQEKDYDRNLREQEGLSPDFPEYQKKMEDFRSRMRVYINERLYPRIPDHRVMCFYPMNKARGEKDNWYLLDFDTRKTLMASHAISGRRYSGKVKQLVTGSIGLDAWEWGVTLFADDPFYFKKIVYEMRYDEASARYGEFGDFVVGLRLEVPELFERLRL